MSEHPNINQFSKTIYLQRYEYFKFFAESYFHNSFWEDILKREKKSTNKLIAFFYLINHKCNTDKLEKTSAPVVVKPETQAKKASTHVMSKPYKRKTSDPNSDAPNQINTNKTQS